MKCEGFRKALSPVGWAPAHRCEIWYEHLFSNRTVWWSVRSLSKCVGAYPTKLSTDSLAPLCKEAK
jgi:hypothetical protein